MSQNLVIFAMILAILAVVGILASGLIVMVRGKDMSGQTSNKLMWWRIYAQAIAIALFALVLYLLKNNG